MRLKQWLAVFLVVVMVTTTTAWAAPAQEEYVTRGEAVEMLLTAADDYRPDAQKSDIIKGYGAARGTAGHPCGSADHADPRLWRVPGIKGK